MFVSIYLPFSGSEAMRDSNLIAQEGFCLGEVIAGRGRTLQCTCREDSVRYVKLQRKQTSNANNRQFHVRCCYF